ncbi:MAG: acyltransferase [Turneriella sp.]|nr:acyltransferase [Turneriella sp.]
MSTSTISYRNDLQGLRAIAVIAVLLFHIWPDSFKGGFIGVDVFFVISGFLITSLLVAEIEKTGQLDLGNFWSRRLRRLLPASTLVLLVSLWACLKWLPETEWLNTTKQVFASGLYFQNWMLISQAVDYMAREANATVAQHYWSLSIEEQFYFAWPLIVFMCAAISRKTGRGIRATSAIFSIILLAGSLFISIFVLRNTPQGYFATTTRAWELALGATLAILWPYLNLANALRITLSWAGLIMVIASVFVVKQGGDFPGFIALLPTMGAVFLILGNEARFAAATLLGMQPLRFVGDISYAIYLWHWPLIVVSKYIPQLQKWPQWQLATAIIGVTFLLSVLTKFIIEDPFRNGFLAFFIKTNRRRFVQGSLATAFVLIAAGTGISAFTWIKEQKAWDALKAKEKATIHPKSEYPGAAAFDPVAPAPVPANMPVIPNPVIAEHDMDGKHAHCMGLTGSMQIRQCEFGVRNGPKTIILAGDSHAMQFGTAIEKVAKLHGWRFVMMVKPACPFGDFSVYTEGYERGECWHFRKEVLRRTLEIKPDLLLVASARAGLFGQISAAEKQIAGFKSYLQKYVDAGIRMGIIRDNPALRISAPGCVLSYGKDHKLCNSDRKLVIDNLKDYLVTVSAMLPETHLVDLTHLYCNKEICPAVIGNILVYRDSHHITDAYGKTMAPYFDQVIRKLLLKPAPTPVVAAATPPAAGK